MTAVHQKRCDETNTYREAEPYAVVVATKRGGVDIVLYGLPAAQAERIATRKNRAMDGESSVHALPERQLEESNRNLHRIISS